MDFTNKISDALQSRGYLAKHPGSSSVQSDIYATNLNSVSEIAQRQRFTGQYVTNATQLQFGSQSTFFLSPGSVLGGLIVSGNVTVPRYTRAPDFWSLNAISTIELVVSGSSSIQSLKVEGRTMMDQIMASLDSNKIQLLRKTNGFIYAFGAAQTVYFSIPLHLFFSSAEMDSLFPLDSSTLQSQILINIRWKQNYECFSGDSVNAVVLPTSFNNLYLRVGDQVSINNNFALSNMMKSDPDLVYSIPGLYLQSYTQVVPVAAVGVGASESMVNLTSMPSGHLQYILMSIRAVAQEGIIATSGLINPFNNIQTLRVMYNGVELYRADSEQELMLLNALNTDQDSGCNMNWTAFHTNVLADDPIEFNLTPVIIIPFANQTSEVLRERRQEHTKDYSGSSIQVFFTVAASIKYTANAAPIYSTGVLANPIGDYRCNFTFANAGLYEITQRSVSLEM